MAPEWLRDVQWRDLAPANFHMLSAKPGSEVLLKLDDLPLLVTGRYGKGRTIAYLGFSPQEIPSSTVKPLVLDRAIRESEEGRLFAIISASLLSLASGETPSVPIETMIEDRARPLFENLMQGNPAGGPKVAARWVFNADGKPHVRIHITNGDAFNFGLRVRLSSAGIEDGRVLPLWTDQYFNLLPHESVDADVTLWLHGGAVREPMMIVAQTIDGAESSTPLRPN
jgi:hypothetical protein